MTINFTEEEIKISLQQYDPEVLPAPDSFKSASVLIPFYSDPEGLSLIFMKRPDYQGPHGGQISFPGGAKDETDGSNLHAALRETEEEIGVSREVVDIWGCLKAQFTSVSRYWVTPFVGLVPFPYQFKPNQAEVERLLIIPLDHLLNPASFSIDTYNWKGFEFPSYLYTYNDDVIWGLTARILFNLISLLTNGEESDSRWPPS
ncbi:CoA pyrophosphatase [bacterium]|nr:CoA pyrophosphatase [bacterium]